jgi:hypothetical protein
VEKAGEALTACQVASEGTVAPQFNVEDGCDRSIPTLLCR